MSDFVLPIFPLDTQAASVTTTVWIGVVVIVFFNLRLGWNLSGLVVPGYLVPLIIAKPISAAVILVEAAITYLITWVISERANRLSHWSSLFGRDRLFALVVVSVLVRAGMDCWLFPRFGGWLNDSYGLNIDYQNDLHSYGLIIVALIANYFWKSGILRGAPPLAATVGITYVIVRYGLIPFTNFNVGGLHYMYDDIASSMLASPKSYIILLTTAFLASWINLRYGWEFNGILIPALLAFQWYAPVKILVSFCEAGLILAIGTGLLRLPIWRGQTMEGSRKILLFFSISFAYRMLAGHLLPIFLPNLQVTDVYGFGYLLATLLATKARDLAAAVRVAKGSLQVSLAGALVASMVGYLMTWMPNVAVLPEAAAEISSQPLPAVKDELVALIRRDKVLFYQQHAATHFAPPTVRDCERFFDGLKLCLRFCSDRDPRTLERGRVQLASVHYDVDIVEGRYLYLRERAPTNGWGLYVIDMTRPDSLSVHVPDPLDEPSNVDAGLSLFSNLDGGSLAIAGTIPRTHRDAWENQTNHSRTFFATFYRCVGHRNVIQLHGPRRHAFARDRADAVADPASCAATLWVKRSLPKSLSVTALRVLIDGFDVEWRPPPWNNRLRNQSPDGFCELVLNQRDRRTLAARGDRTMNRRDAGRVAHRKGHLNEWLLTTKDQIARRGSNQYVRPTPDELLYLDVEVLAPLLTLTRQLDRIDQMTPEQSRELEAIASTAAVFHYEILLWHDVRLDEDFIILLERTPWEKHWGTCVLRMGLRQPYVVEIPRPLFERNAFEFGVAQFSRPPASALIIAGAHPRSNADGAADVVRIANRISLFHLTHQALLRARGDQPTLVIQARAIRAPVSADIVVATHDGSVPGSVESPFLDHLVGRLEADGMRLQFADGSADVAGYEIGMTLQSLSMDYSTNKELVGLWLSPSLRTKFRQHPENLQQEKQFAAIGIPTTTAELCDYLQELEADPATVAVPELLRNLAEEYIDAQDIVRLRRLQLDWPEYRLTRFIDRGSGQVFLLIQSRSANSLPWVMNLSGGLAEQSRSVVVDALSREAVLRFVDSRSTWFIVRKQP